MPIAIHHANNELIIAIDGLLTFHQHEDGDKLINQISDAMAEHKPRAIRLNLSKTQSLDSHWLGVLIRLFRRAKEKNIDLTIDHASADIRRLLGLVQIDRIIEIRS